MTYPSTDWTWVRPSGEVWEVPCASVDSSATCTFWIANLPNSTPPGRSLRDERMARATRNLRSLPVWAISAIVFVTIAGALTFQDSPRSAVAGEEHWPGIRHRCHAERADAERGELRRFLLQHRVIHGEPKWRTASTSSTTVSPTVNHSGASYRHQTGRSNRLRRHCLIVSRQQRHHGRGNRRGRKYHQDLHRHRNARCQRLSRPSESQRHRT